MENSLNIGCTTFGGVDPGTVLTPVNLFEPPFSLDEGKGLMIEVDEKYLKDFAKFWVSDGI